MKIMYANGCSLTEGVELGNLVFSFDEKKHGPNMSRYQIAQMSEQEYPSKNLHVTYMENNSYPKLLGDKLGLLVVNKAIGGSSNSSIVRRTMLDVIELLKLYDPSDIFVFIGLTDIFRSEIPNCENPRGKIEFGQVAPAFPVEPHVPAPYRKYKEYVNLYRNTSLKHMMFDFFRLVLELQNFLKAKGVEYRFSLGLGTAASYFFDKHEIDETHNTPIELLYSEVDFSKWVFPNFVFNYTPSTYKNFIDNAHMTGFISFSREYDKGNGYHPLEEAHKDWADVLYNILKDDLCKS